MKKLPSKKLSILLKEDQKNIKDFHDKKISLDEMRKNSQKLSKKFKKIILKEGFPFKNIATKEEYKAGIALSLHLPIKDLKNILKALKKASELEIDSKYIAFFIDKIKIAEKKPQIYGTQVRKKTNRKFELFEIEDEKNVDKRRKEMGLEPIKEYLSKFVS